VAGDLTDTYRLKWEKPVNKYIVEDAQTNAMVKRLPMTIRWNISLGM